jgi:hypothetical protein
MSTLLIKTANEAVEADRNGNLDDAIDRYIKCVELIMKLISKAEEGSKEKETLKQRANEYAKRAEELKRLRSEQLPSSPGTNFTQNTTTKNSTDPSFNTVGATAVTGATTGLLAGVAVVGAPLTLAVMGGVGGAYLATRQDKTGETARNLGDTARSTLVKAQEVDRKYDISNKTKKAAVKTYQTAVEIEKKYDLSGKATRTAEVVTKAATTGVDYVKKVDEKYDVSGKTVAVAKAGWEGAKAGTRKLSEVNEKYKVTEKVGNAASNAWNFVSGAFSGDNRE